MTQHQRPGVSDERVAIVLGRLEAAEAMLERFFARGPILLIETPVVVVGSDRPPEVLFIPPAIAEAIGDKPHTHLIEQAVRSVMRPRRPR